MSRIILYPYKIGSKGAKKVQEHIRAAGVECLRVHGDGEYHPKRGDLIIGWGSGSRPTWAGLARENADCYLNTSDKICNSVNKIDSFNAFKRFGVSCAPFTFNHNDAIKWLREGKTVVVRLQVEGMDGAGIDIVTPGDAWLRQLPMANLYTQLVQTTDEYRVHIFSRHAIYWQKRVPLKAVDSDIIRTSSNGWGFRKLAHYEIPKACEVESIKAIEALGLDFGATDVMFDRNTGTAYILETNTAPELGPDGSAAYAKAILSLEV